MGVNKVMLGDKTLIDISNATVTANKLLKGETAYNAAGNLITGKAQSYAEGYDQGLADATPNLTSVTVTPSTEFQSVTPPSGYDGFSHVNVYGDAELLPENIKKDVEIFGVTGELAGGEGGYCWAKIDPTTIDTNTLLLLHADSFSDSGGNDVYVSSGGTTISEAQSKFGDKSFYFDGSSYMTIGNDIVLGTGNFTIDFWVYRSSSSAAFRRWITSSIGAWTGNTFCVRESNTSAVNTTLATSSTTIASGAWHHIAVVRNGSTQTIYIDGVSSASVSDSTNYSEPIKYIGGCYETSGTEYFVGYMDEIRISNTARWTSNFTVPTSQYEEEKVLGYVLSDNKDEYPVNGFHTDGYYYRRLDDNIPWYEEGSYYWSKSDTDGNFIAYVVSDQPDEFPEDGTLDGYYYKLQQGTYDEGVEYGMANAPSNYVREVITLRNTYSTKYTSELVTETHVMSQITKPVFMYFTLSFSYAEYALHWYLYSSDGGVTWYNFMNGGSQSMPVTYSGDNSGGKSYAKYLVLNINGSEINFRCHQLWSSTFTPIDLTLTVVGQP